MKNIDEILYIGESCITFGAFKKYKMVHIYKQYVNSFIGSSATFEMFSSTIKETTANIKKNIHTKF